MKGKIFQITVGIPAYNEQANIKNLLASIFSQTEDGFVLREVLIVSDGSTDNTEKLVKAIPDKRLRLISHGKRQGIGAAQNTIVKNATGDILVILNADVLPSSGNFLKELIKPIARDSQVGLVGADVASAPPTGFFESIIAYSHDFKTEFYRSMGGGHNVYLCHGRARAFSRTLYKKIKWPGQFMEDGYSYFFARLHNFKFVYQRNAQVLFRSPKTFQDHAGQSSRFWAGKKALDKYFDPAEVKAEFDFSHLKFLETGIKYTLKDPLRMFLYFIIASIIALRPSKRAVFNYSRYEVATTSKSLE